MMYQLVARPAIDWAENQSLYILSDHTNIIRYIRDGKSQQIAHQLDDLAWLQISIHASRIAEGKTPPESLRKDISYHCGQLRSTVDRPEEEKMRTRSLWCTALNS